MENISGIIPVLPVSLVSMFFLMNKEIWSSEFDLKVGVHNLITALKKKDVHVYIPRQDLDYAINVGLRMLILRHIVEESKTMYRANPEELELLKYYSNSISHYN